MQAPGQPGINPTWTSSAKDMVGCALGPSRLWFTTGFGIVNEVYSPRIDLPQIRDLGFIVADDKGFWVEIKRLDNYQTRQPQPGVPAIDIVHTHPRFELQLRIVPDPQREVLMIDVVLRGDADLRPYALLAPHLGGSGHDNLAQAGWHHGRRLLWAEQGAFGLALACVDAAQNDAWGTTSAGYVGVSDGWQDFKHNGRMAWQYDDAGPGNVALLGQMPRAATLALGFASSKESAATLALSAACQPFNVVWRHHTASWKRWQHQVQCPDGLPTPLHAQLATSAMVLRVHQDKTFAGAMVASLSVPWGNANDNTGGYHLVWPRDLVESAGGLLALGALSEARDVLRYLMATQQANGSWSQNQWLGGKPFWNGSQLDEAAFPVLLVAALAERDALDGIEVTAMVRAALAFIVGNGPATDQDRWEEDAGINAFTMATCIAALVSGAPWMEEPAREWVLRFADDWNAHVEDWTTVQDTTLARAHGVPGYYVRIAPTIGCAGDHHLECVLAVKNRLQDPGLAAEDQVATDFLQLVRLGLRDPHDPLVTGTIQVIDQLLKVDTPCGPAWHRYNGDGYGEHADGSPFDGTGVGRAWPLLTGERGHYELVAGRDPLPFLQAMADMTGRCGLIPEQVWDTEPMPGRGLVPGKPSGSAMPLVWAHAEFVKLAASRALGRPFDRPEAVWQRYGGRRPQSEHVFWSLQLPIRQIRAGQTLCLALPHGASVHYGSNGWQDVADCPTQDSGLALHIAVLPTAALAAASRIDFTVYWSDTGVWDGHDHHVDVV
ncbi:MAG: glycoside hydrolase family 15 protein [Burkholderiaceae bacterium]